MLTINWCYDEDGNEDILNQVHDEQIILLYDMGSIERFDGEKVYNLLYKLQWVEDKYRWYQFNVCDIYEGTMYDSIKDAIKNLLITPEQQVFVFDNITEFSQWLQTYKENK